MHSATLFKKPLKPERYSCPFCMMFSTKESQVGTNFIKKPEDMCDRQSNKF